MKKYFVKYLYQGIEKNHCLDVDGADDMTASEIVDYIETDIKFCLEYGAQISIIGIFSL